jgi:hypothetical protein
MPNITPAEMARRFRKNADDCDRVAAINHIRRISRERLTRTAMRYRALADTIELDQPARAPANPDIRPRRL